MNKFLKNLMNADNQTLQRRAESINTRAKMAYDNYINNIKLEIENKNLKYQDLVDMGPETTTSLSPSSSNWDPQKWIEQLQSIQSEIYLLQISLKIALVNYQDLFSEEEAKTTDKKTQSPSKD